MTVDGYIGAFPPVTQAKLSTIRSLIRRMAPEAEELFSYGMPAYKLYKKPLIYFGAYEKHIGIYPVPQALSPELGAHRVGRGTLHFRLDQMLPLRLIEQLVQVRIDEVTR